jgi:LRR receptor-like serine/threonine-protein kinase EFR
VGGIPVSFGQLINLKCMYFSHNNLTAPLPSSLENLKNLQVFLARSNSMTGRLLNFSRLPKLVNIWLDGNKLEGTLTSFGTLQELTFLKIDSNQFHGVVPAELCSIHCDASSNKNLTCPLPIKGCCQCTVCGDAPSVPLHPPKPSMGECIPQ